MTEDDIEDAPDIDVTETEPMPPPQIDKSVAIRTFAQEFAKAIVERGPQPPIIDIESLPLDILTMVPQYERWYWYKGWKRDPTDRNRIIYDFYVSPQKLPKLLAKSTETINTRWGPEKAKVFKLWTVIKGRTYDPTNKRVVPIRQVVMTHLMARRGADVAKLLDKLTPEIIKKSVEKIGTHESLIWAEAARTKGQEAKTAWAIVEQKADSHFSSTEKMLSYAGEAEDKGDVEFSKSFTQNKNWKDKLIDNLCWLIILVGILVYIIWYLFVR
jgi:hypothetical protein